MSTINLYHKNLLTLKDWTPDEIDALVTLAKTLKHEKKSGAEIQRLCGKNIALIFEKPSTRTRCSFEVAAFDQGAKVSYLKPSEIQLGAKESIKDTARVLGRLYDGIEYRGFEQANVETLAQFAGVPVWNGLTRQYHPTQALADLLTIQEHSHKSLDQTKVCFIGDGNSNVARSLMMGCAKIGIECWICAPNAYQPEKSLIRLCQEISNTTQTPCYITQEIDQAVKHADFIYTDVWLSMGEDQAHWARRIDALLPYQVNATLMAKTNNPNCKFMHCLPAFHNRETQMGEQIFQQFGLAALEVTNDVFESTQSIVFDQAENRLHTIKALMVLSLVDCSRSSNS